MSPLLSYVEKDFRADTLADIVQANRIIAEYMAAGFKLTLRQLYYQFVARDLIPNTQRSYKRLGSIINDGRLAGLIDWEAIEDRTRNVESLAHWDDPSEILNAVGRQYRTERWANQPTRVEVWIEKEALAGVFERICESLDVAYLSCRGYTSQSEMWAAAQRLIEYEEAGQDTIILHFGDQGRQQDRESGGRDAREAARTRAVPPLPEDVPRALISVCSCGSRRFTGSEWGVILAIRTGPAELGQWAVTRMRRFGRRCEGGRILDMRSGEELPCESEAAFFEYAKLSCLPPRFRDSAGARAPQGHVA